MALHIKFQAVRREDIDYVRFKSTIEFFSALSKSLRFDNLTTYLFVGNSLDDTYQKRDFDFGLLESYFRKELTKKGTNSAHIGLAIEGKIKLEQHFFQFLYETMPRALCLKEGFDARLEILPNAHAEVFEDLAKYAKDLKIKIFQRIKEYSQLSAKKHSLDIKRVVLSKCGDEYDNIMSWDYFYAADESDFLTKIIDASDALSERLSFGNKQKFVNHVLERDDFAFILSKHSKEENVALAGNSISVSPKDDEAMKKFITKIANDLNIVARAVYKKEDEVINLIDETLSKLH